MPDAIHSDFLIDPDLKELGIVPSRDLSNQYGQYGVTRFSIAVH